MLAQLLISLLFFQAAESGIFSQVNVGVPMRDGARLSTNIFRPGGQRRVPAILMRTPYGKPDKLSSTYRAFVDRGYAVVLQDVRGRFRSEGVFQPLTQESNDGYDTLTWIAKQRWCDGKIGMIGGSYGGIVQWRVAAMNHPNLKAIFPIVSGYDEYFDRFYSRGGAMKIGHRLLWMSQNMRAKGFRPPDFIEFVRTIPLRNADRVATGQVSEMYQQVLNHPAYDGFWESISTRAAIENVTAPAFIVTGWYDNFCQSDLEAYAALSRRSKSNRIVVGPWAHNISASFPDADFGGETAVAVGSLQFQWFDHWLKGKTAPLFQEPPVKIFVMGLNRWRRMDEWPPGNASPTAFYLASRGQANTAEGDGRLVNEPSRRSRADVFQYDPKDPVPTRGGAVCCNPEIFPWGPIDQRAIERRQDVLVYSSDILDEDVEVSGPVQAVLYVSTSEADTDFTVKLVDVHPEGYVRNLTDGILRLRYRDSLREPKTAQPREIYKITIDAGVTSHVFLKGHRIRIQVSSSNFPRFDRNLNTGGPAADETQFRVARQTVYHDRRRPSHVLLPVVRK